jgi:hypothetical protein
MIPHRNLTFINIPSIGTCDNSLNDIAGVWSAKWVPLHGNPSWWLTETSVHKVHGVSSCTNFIQLQSAFLYQTIHICHITVCCYSWCPATVPFGRSVKAVSTLPHLLISTPQADRCCHHALCPEESDHSRDHCMPSHFEPSYQYPVKTVPNTLDTAHNLGKIFQCIQLLVHHILISSSTCHVVLLTELLQYNNCSLASNMQVILTLAPQFSTNLRPAEHIPCSHRIRTVTLQQLAQ